MSAPDYSKISTEDHANLDLVLADTDKKLEKLDVNVLEVLKPLVRGLSSHKPSKRAGYAALLSVLLKKYRDRIPEADAVNYISNFDFSKKTKKSAKRTVTLAKVTALTIFIRSEILTSDKAVEDALAECSTIAFQKPQLQAYICACLASMTIDTKFRFFEETAGSIQKSLDALIFYYKLRPYIPEDKLEVIPEEFRKSMWSIEAADYILKTMHTSKQPWTSMLWKLLITEGKDDDLLSFWQSIVMKDIRGAEDKKKKITALLIVKSVFPILRESLYSVVICSSFIRLINNLLVIPMDCSVAVEFLDFIINETTPEKLKDVLKAFSYVHAHLPSGFDFHRRLFDKCSIEQLKEEFKNLTAEDPNQLIEFRQRISSEKGDYQTRFNNFKFDKLRALFISTALHNDQAFTIQVFDTLFEKWDKQRSKLVADLVAYDDLRVEGAATLPQILKKPDLPHFDSCYLLYSLCTGSSSSPSLDTIIPPAISESEPSSDLIMLAMQHANEPLLIQHAYKMYLKAAASKITTDQLGEFIKNYVPAEDTFTENSVEIIKVAIDSVELSFNIIGPLFQLFCKTLTNCNDNVAKPLSNLIISTLKRESKDFSLQTVLESVFTSMNELPNRIVTQHEKRIQPVFSEVLEAIIKSKLPLTQKCMNIISKQLEEAVSDFAFKSTPHFCLTIFTEFVKLPSTVPHCLFVPIIKTLPKAKKLRSRVELMNLITAITANPKELDTLLRSHHKEFATCVNALLDEVKNGGSSKEDEKRQEKVMRGIKSWLANIEKKRGAVAELEIGDIRRRLNAISSRNSVIGGIADGLLKQLQKLELQVHTKHRQYV